MGRNKFPYRDFIVSEKRERDQGYGSITSPGNFHYLGRLLIKSSLSLLLFLLLIIINWV